MAIGTAIYEELFNFNNGIKDLGLGVAGPSRALSFMAPKGVDLSIENGMKM